MALEIDTIARPAETVYDTGQAERFAERLLGALNEASLVVMTSIGKTRHRRTADAGEVFVMQRYIDMIDEALEH